MMNIGNLTAPVWSMLFDIFLFNGQFKWFYIVGFVLQIISMVMYSLKDPVYPNTCSQGDNCELDELYMEIE